MFTVDAQNNLSMMEVSWKEYGHRRTVENKTHDLTLRMKYELFMKATCILMLCSLYGVLNIALLL